MASVFVVALACLGCTGHLVGVRKGRGAGVIVEREHVRSGQPVVVVQSVPQRGGVAPLFVVRVLREEVFEERQFEQETEDLLNVAHSVAYEFFDYSIGILTFPIYPLISRAYQPGCRAPHGGDWESPPAFTGYFKDLFSIIYPGRNALLFCGPFTDAVYVETVETGRKEVSEAQELVKRTGMAGLKVHITMGNETKEGLTDLLGAVVFPLPASALSGSVSVKVPSLDFEESLVPGQDLNPGDGSHPNTKVFVAR